MITENKRVGSLSLVQKLDMDDQDTCARLAIISVEGLPIEAVLKSPSS